MPVALYVGVGTLEIPPSVLACAMVLFMKSCCLCFVGEMSLSFLGDTFLQHIYWSSGSYSLSNSFSSSCSFFYDNSDLDEMKSQ